MKKILFTVLIIMSGIVLSLGNINSHNIPAMPEPGNITTSDVTCPADFSVCINSSAINLNDSFPAGGTITGTGVTSGIFDPSVAGAGGHIITYTNVTSCTFTITVDPLPSAAGAITGTATVCQGQNTVTYSVPTISNATSYDWEYSGTGTTITGTGNSVTISFSTTATAGNLSVFGVNSCGNGTVSANFPVTVNLLPVAAGTITGTATLCQGTNSVSYSVPTITGATSYGWAYSGTGATITGSSASVTISFNATATSGNLTVHGINTCGSGTNSANYPITVESPVAAAGTITGTATVCQGQSSVSYSVSAVTNASSYSWTYSGTGATITGSTNSVTISFSASATGGILKVRGVNSCGNGTYSPNYTITMSPLPSSAGNISGTATVCQGQNNVTYTVSAIANSTSYGWAYSGTGATITGTSNSVTISYNATATSGNLTVHGINACGNGNNSSNYAVTVNPLPAAAGTITGTATVCQSQSGVSYSVPTITGATSYSWSYSATGATITGSSASVTISFNSSATSGNLTVHGVNSCGSGTTSATYAITVNPLPSAAGAITGTSTVCQGQSTVSYSVSTITNATSYSWSYSGTGATITGSTASITISFSASATGGNLTVHGINSCGNGTNSANYAITVSPLPAAAGTITGTATVCQGQNTVTYTVPTIANSTSYNWTYSGTGATITGTGASVTISFSTTATNGNLTVNGVNSCGNGTVSANYAITVNPLPVAAGTITGTSIVCQGQTGVSYSVPSVTNATSYSWAYSGTGATITGSSTTVSINFSAAATNGNLTVHGVNACGNGIASADYAVTLTTLPVAAGTITGTSSVCVGQSDVTYTVPNITNATSYSWTYSGAGATITNNGTSATINFSFSATSGNLTVHGINTCGNGTNSANYAITVNPLPVAAGAITGTATVCQGQTGVSYSIPTITYATSYNWSYSGIGATISNGSTVTISFNDTATSGNLTVHGVNSCGNGTISADFPITVNLLPAEAGTITGTSIVCQGQSDISFTVPVITNATDYHWNYNGTGATITQNADSATVSFSITATSGNLSVYGSGNNCNGAVSADFPVTVNPLPDINSISDIILCNAEIQPVVTISGAVPGTIYTWTNSNAAIGLAAGGTGDIPSFTAVNPGISPVTSTINVYDTANFCGGNPFIFTITVNPEPTVDPINDTINYCSGIASSPVTFTGSVPGTVFVWTNSNPAIGLSASGTGNILSFTTTNTTNDYISGNILITPLFINGTDTCAGSPTSMTITVTPLPTVNSINNQNVCNGSTTSDVIFSGSVTGTTFNWENSDASIGLGQSGTNTSSIPGFNAINNSYTIITATVNVTPTANGCFGTPVHFFYEIYPTPDVFPPPENLSVCHLDVMQQIVFTSHVTGASYSWTNSNTSIGLGSVGTGNINSFTGNNPGNIPVSSVISVTPHYYINGNLCDGIPVTFTISVNPIPYPEISGNNTVCENESWVPYNGNQTNNYDYMVWNISNGSGSFMAGNTGPKVWIHWVNPDSQTFITAMETNSFGCDNSNVFHMAGTSGTAPDTIDIFLLGNKTLVCPQPPAYQHYEWFAQSFETNIIDTVTSCYGSPTCYFDNFDPLAYWYCVEYWNNGNADCKTRSCFNQPNVIAEHNNNLDFEISPNPNNGSFKIELTDKILGNITLTIEDETGRIIHEYQMFKSSEFFSRQIKLPEYCKGFYFVKLSNNKSFAVTRKMIVQ
ncbi:MAG: T9SS type A sorting domain-containing protein [Bacteroidia bacterium]|nr:T9SS type A sorting domain-containing protein [Bacteroidia bacterium]